MIGEVLKSRYRVIAQLGAGGMGMVYQAVDELTNQLVAIKTLPPILAMDREFVRRFQREAEALAQLNHPHIVKLIETFEERGDGQGHRLRDRSHSGGNHADQDRRRLRQSPDPR